MTDLKLKEFERGWNEYAKGMIMPEAMYDKDLGKFISWENMLEPLTVFQAYELGLNEGRDYFEAVNGKS